MSDRKKKVKAKKKKLRQLAAQVYSDTKRKQRLEHIHRHRATPIRKGMAPPVDFGSKELIMNKNILSSNYAELTKMLQTFDNEVKTREENAKKMQEDTEKEINERISQIITE